MAYTQPGVRISPAPPLSPQSKAFQDDEDESSELLISEQTELKTPTSSKVRHKLRHLYPGFLDVSEVAKRLNKSVSTVTRWCETGKLPAYSKSYGKKTSFFVSALAIEVYLQEKGKSEKKQGLPKGANNEIASLSPSELIAVWKRTMERGGMTGRAFSPVTVSDYLYYVGKFQTKHKHLNIQTFKTALLDVPVKQFATRFKVYKALMCYAKFLIQNGLLKSEFLEEAKPLYPKRHLPPKRLTVNEEQILKLLAACHSCEEVLIVTFLAQTGLRASEACSIWVSDVQLEDSYLWIRRGKGGKERKVGLGRDLKANIAAYLADTNRLAPTNASPLFLDNNHNGLNRFGLAKRIEKIGKRIGIKVTPHALRRAFVTINANKGRPLQMLQKACGHSSIKTTMDYCQTTEEELIEAMKGWN